MTTMPIGMAIMMMTTMWWHDYSNTDVVMMMMIFKLQLGGDDGDCGDDDNDADDVGGWVGLDLFNDDTRPAGHISRRTHVGSLAVYNLWKFISDTRIRLLVKFPLCKSRESSQRWSSKSQQCSVHPEFPVKLHSLRACGQWSTSFHNGGK